jgi:hypothetical protein
VPGGLATASIVIACVWTALQALSMVLSFSAAEQLARAESAGADLRGVYTAYDSVAAWLLPVEIAALVVSCLWLQASRHYAVVASPAVRHARGPVWVWLGWVVPVVSLWFPYQVVRDVRAGTPGVARGGLGLWWACWLVAMWFTNQSSFASLGWRPEGLGSIPVFEVGASVATLVAAVQWVRIVREVTAAQRVHASRTAS